MISYLLQYAIAPLRISNDYVLQMVDCIDRSVTSNGQC